MTSVYVLTSNEENVNVYSTKEKAIESVRDCLDDDDGAGWDSDYYNETYKMFVRGEYEIPIGESIHIEGGVTYLHHVTLDDDDEYSKYQTF